MTTISIDYITTSHIDISTTNNVILDKNDFLLILNFSIFQDFSLTKLGYNKYRITPNTNFSLLDILTLKTFSSNTIYIYFYSIFESNTISTTLFVDKSFTSGTYSLCIHSINDEQLDINTGNFIICNGINSTKSSVTPSSNLYNSNNISLNVTLFDSLGLKVPDGNYLIKLKIEEGGVSF